MTRQYLTDAAERVAATFVETFAAVEGSDLLAHGLTISGTRAAAIAALSAALAVVKVAAAKLIGNRDSASLAPDQPAPQTGHSDAYLLGAGVVLVLVILVFLRVFGVI